MVERPEPTRSTADRLLGFGGPGAWAMYASFAATVLILALNGGAPSESPAGIVATVAVLAAGLIGVLPGPYPMSVPRTAAIVGLTALCNLLITVQLSPDVWPGWASWNFGMTAIALMTLSLRGRIVAGWAGLGFMAAIAVTWSWIAGGSPRMGFDLVYMHLGINLAITFFALGLRRAVTQITALRAVEAARAAELAARDAVEAERLAELHVLATEVGPTLERIAAGHAADDDAAAVYRVLEARLRDRIRARRLESPTFRAAVDAARERGVDVLLLDDAADELLDEERLDETLSWAAEILARTTAGSATVRLAGPGTVALSVVTTDPPTRQRSILHVQTGPDGALTPLPR